MSSSRPVVTPTNPFPPTSAQVSSTTPPPPPPPPPTTTTALAGVAGPSASTSPSPRSRSNSAGRNPGYPGSRSHFPFLHGNTIDNAASLAGPDLPWAPASSRPLPPNPNPPRSSSLAASSTSNPPRSSSLLPPARIVVDRGSSHASSLDRSDWFNDPRPAPKIPEHVRGDSSRHRRGHSRSSSTGGLSDTLRNLNRWSVSTTSSRASHLADFTRRVSTEILEAVAFNSSPGRKLHRRRPSTSGGSPRSSPRVKNRAESPVVGAIPPLQSLPRISAGPSLEHEVLESHVLGQTVAAAAAATATDAQEESGRQQQQHQQLQQESDGSWNDHREWTNNENGSSLLNHPHAAEPQSPPDMVTHETAMAYVPNGQVRSRSGSRSAGAKGERDRDRDRERDRQGRPMSQKAMLSKALQKANTAVQLDNAQNYEGARRAYAEACAVLHQVLLRTSGEEDRRKLEAIHETYLMRVMELDEQLVDMEPEGKELPRRPESNDYQDMLDAQVADDHYLRPYRTGRNGAFHDDLDSVHPNSVQESRRSPPPPPPSRASPLPDTAREPRDGTGSYLTQQYSLQSAFSSRARHNNGGSALRPPAMDDAYMPPPLSPRRPPSPGRPSSPPIEYESPQRPPPDRPNMQAAAPLPSSSSGHHRINSHESVSWLAPIDESDRSSVTSVHSRSSSRIVRKHIRAPSGATEAEFDAALDDAIEAAYDDGYEPEPDYHPGHSYHDAQVDPITDKLRRVEMARELVRESEREALELATEREQRLRLQQQFEDEEYQKRAVAGDDFYDGNDSEEERLLEEAPRTDDMDDFAFGVGQRAAVPRESDSSGMTGRTWHSSMGSNHATGATLTPVSEDGPHPHHPSPLPSLPPQPGSAGSQSSGQSVRNRRLSGQNRVELKIDTNKQTTTAAPATAGAALPSQPKAGNYIVQQRQALSAGSNRTLGPFTSRRGPSPVPGTLDEEPENGSQRPTALPHEEHSRVGTPSVVRAPTLRKNYSSSSLKSIRTRNLSISHIDEGTSDHSPSTPISSHFGTRLPAVPSLPAGILHNHQKDRANSTTTSGLHLFENDFHSSERPGSPNPLTTDAPAPLEPCPTDVMLRPFWLMRALYQTLCHPRGGYLSNKLFVPRDVWRVKGVKLKAVEDKIANCDLLTAALQRLARVDTCDADAVLEEMQALEGVLEQVQATLSRKLGSEVGVQGASSMFKDAAAAAAAAAGDGAAAGGDAAAMPRSASVTSKASSFSWRRLRSKNSAANLPGLTTSGYGGKGPNGSTTNLSEGLGKDAALASLPMTTHPTSRPTKRDVNSVTFTGPNANYMSSLARLFDAAQTVDQIARQVEDPGLRHADKTQVGLELCARHAAEFFAFYICRFALSDLTLLMDKFVKRGSEWVLA